MRQLSESVIVRELAENVCRQITRRVVRSLQAMRDCQLSGEDSVLQNVWDEICVQVQYEQLMYWDALEQTVMSLVTSELTKRVAFEREAIWLSTAEGVDWSCREETDREPSPVIDTESVDHIVRENVYTEASRLSNPQIKLFLDQSC